MIENLKPEIHFVEQNTPEWFDLRLGRITASGVKNVLAKGAGKTRAAYMNKLIAEILTGEHQDSYKSAAMIAGSETEPQARSFYELSEGVEVSDGGFISLGKHLGCSPDGLVGDEGLVEIKCPLPQTQVDWLLKGKMPSQHVAQVQMQLWVSDRKWCDFVSFVPSMKKGSYFKVRVERNEEKINEIKAGCERFLSELDKNLSNIK